jgi:hypothetical protein
MGSMLRKMRRGRERERLLSMPKEDRFVLVWMMHFGNRLPCEVTCVDCADFRSGVCEGGADDVVECMQEHAEKAVFFGNWPC